jgi:hypothetical protein
VHVRLPAQGRERAALMQRFTEWSAKETAKWNKGQVSGGIYHGRFGAPLSLSPSASSRLIYSLL